jgi:hypothetical protein
MHIRKIPALALFAALAASAISAEPLASPTWGFRVDLPEEYEYLAGDGKEKFSFSSPAGASFELVVYPPTKQAAYPTLEALAADVKKRLSSNGETSVFDYRGRKAALLELDFPSPSAGGKRLSGWGLCLELEAQAAGKPLLLALAYGDATNEDIQALHLSALDSLAPMEGDKRSPGPVTAFGYPRGERAPLSPFGLSLEAYARENDAEGAQALAEREFEVLKRSADTPQWQEAWARFYRAIHRDSFERLSEIAFALERHWSEPAPGTAPGAASPWDLAGRALEWTQGFSYERDLSGSDFVNPVSAAVEGRGDCDSRAMLWAIILEQANIPAAIMVSADYSHAMGLTDIAGPGARFGWKGTQWLVAETTATVSLGRIEQKMSDPALWLGIIFE